MYKRQELDIRTIAPGHGPAIEASWRSLLNDYRRWGEGQQNASLTVALLFASAYGNTAAIADALARGVSRTGIRVNSLNCEFTPADELVSTIQQADAVLIGSPTLGGHAPTRSSRPWEPFWRRGIAASPWGCSADSAGAARPWTCSKRSCGMAASPLVSSLSLIQI